MRSVSKEKVRAAMHRSWDTVSVGKSAYERIDRYGKWGVMGNVNIEKRKKKKGVRWTEAEERREEKRETGRGKGEGNAISTLTHHTPGMIFESDARSVHQPKIRVTQAIFMKSSDLVPGF